MFDNNALVPANALSQMSEWNIVDARIDEDANRDNGSCIITFANGYTLHLQDVGQSCCEHRYMRTDDDLTAMVGSRLVSIRVVDVTESGEMDYDVHEMSFLKIQTDRAGVTVVTHNEHNGYYGGFMLKAFLFDSSGKELGAMYIPD